MVESIEGWMEMPGLVASRDENESYAGVASTVGRNLDRRS